MQDRISQKNSFLGGMNSDDAQTAIQENDYLRATNVRGSINEAQQFQIISNIKGNTLTNYSLPSGYNKVIGAYEDLFLNTAFYFVYNSNSEHSILRYYPQSNTIVKVVQDPVFDWDIDTNITHCDFVDGHLLYWVDPLPREIDVIQATDDKQRAYTLVQTEFNTVFVLTIFDENGAALDVFPVNGADYDEIAADINSQASAYVTAESCHDYITLIFNEVNAYTVTYEDVLAEPIAIAIPDNFYPSYTERNIYRGKYPHPCPPLVSAVNSPDRDYNLIKEKHFQFMIRLVMKDNSKTVYSPISDITLTDCATNNYNGIRVDFTNLAYSNIDFLSILQRIEIVAREGNLGKFSRVKTLERYEIWNESGLITEQYFDFFNDGNYETIDDFSANRPWDAVGREIQTQVFADNRLFDANILENYDKPCPDILLEAEFTESSKQKLFYLTGTLKIWVENFYGTGLDARSGFIYNLGDVDGVPQPDVWGGCSSDEVRDTTASFGQQLGVAGAFTIYDACNTNIFTTSRQDDNHGLPITASGALSASTPEEKDAILAYIASITPGQTTFLSSWALRGLTAGVHVIRVASPWCGFQDPLGKGGLYDLNGRGFHKTSCSIKTWTTAALSPLGDFIYEIRVEIDPNGDFRIYSSNSTVPHSTGTAFSDGNIFVGEVTVYDKINVRDESEKQWTVDGYLIDADASSDNNQLATNGLFMERQLVKKREIASDSGIEREAQMIVDHNGYFFFTLDGVNPPGQATVIEFRAESSNSYLIKEWIDDYKFFPQGSGAATASRDDSILRALYEQMLVNSTSGLGIGTDSPDASYAQVLLFNNNINVSKENRTRIKGIVEDTNGVGLGGLSVLYERNGRQELTGADGSFEIIAYVEVLIIPSPPVRVVDNIIINNPNDCEIRFDYAGNPDSLFYLDAPAIVFFGSPYGDSELDAALIDFDMGLIVGSLIGSTGNRYLKGGGNYQFALLYVDDMFRRCDLVLSDKVYIPFTTENRNKIRGVTNTLSSGASNGFFTFTMNIGGTPPDWAKYVFVLRTLDATYNFYLQFPLNDVKYVVDYDGVNVIETTYETSTASQIWLNLSEALAKYQLKNPDSTKAYTFVEGDRIRLISDANGTLVTRDGQPALLDFKIIGEQALGDSTYLVIENLDTLPKLQGGTFIEVYSPKLTIDKEAFYEIHTCIEIESGAYSTPTFELDTGDAYLRTRIVPIESGVAVNQIQDDSISDFYISNFSDIGRVSFPNPDFKEILRTNAIRFSGKFYEDTKVNNLSTFELLNIEQTPKRLGAINATRVTNDDNYRAVILLICENNVASAYIGDVILSDVAGTDVISLSTKVLPAIRILKGDYGTTHPSSVAARDGMVFWWDGLRHSWVRYALNGLFPISDYKFKSYSDSINPDVAEGVWDLYYEQYICTHYRSRVGVIVGIGLGFAVITMDSSGLTVGQDVSVNGTDRQIVDLNATTITVATDASFETGMTVEVVWNRETVSFDERKKRWTSFLDYYVEKYISVDDKLVSFKNGALWLHDANPLYNNFHGTQFNSDITFVFNPEPFMIKLFYQMRMQANSKWTAPEITLLDNASYPTGMRSRVKADNIKLYEGQFWCDFLRDMNDPRFNNTLQALLQGRNLRGEVMKITLENTSTSLATLRQAEVFTYQSMLTTA